MGQNYKMRHTAQRGFTMIEIIIVIVLIGVIGSLAANILFQGSDIYVSETNRQGFVSEARSSFWRIMRESQGQASSADFSSSGQKFLGLKNAKGETIDFLTESTGEFKRRLNDGNYNVLSNSLSYSDSEFSYFDNNFNKINVSQSDLSNEAAETVHLIKLDLIFLKNENLNNEDKLSLSSYVYPLNFGLGKNMSYHNYE